MPEQCDTAIYSSMAVGRGNDKLFLVVLTKLGHCKNCRVHELSWHLPRTPCHNQHTLTRAEAGDNIVVPPQACDGFGPCVELPAESAKKRNRARNTQAGATLHDQAHASHLNASFAVELQVAVHGGLRSGEGEVGQGDGNWHVDAHVATFDFELELSGCGACSNESEARGRAHNVQVQACAGAEIKRALMH
jgi:hypothetical protein